MKNKYKFYNSNPDNVKTEDCVCRAISTATGLNYNAVNNLLEITAQISDCPKLCLCSYHTLLENILCYKRQTCWDSETVNDIAIEFPYCNIIVRIEGHLTSIIKGTILDIWDCSNKKVDCFWIVV